MKIYLSVFALTIFSILAFKKEHATPIQFSYKTISIGGKTWMAENFKGNNSCGSCYEDNTSNCNNMGRLYAYEDAVKSAPPGWHLPAKTEWDTLLNSIRKEGKDPYEVLSEGKFNAKFAGYKDAYGDYTKINYQVRFWSATEWGNDNNNAWYMYLNKSRQIADVDTDEKKCLFSVRYVKDEEKKTSR